jgi:osmotically-inducible protein OsmY
MNPSVLESRVLANLAERAWVGGDFEVKAAGDGAVILSGTVPNESSRQRMLRIARRTLGVIEVRDQLRVDPSSARPAGPTVDDGELARRVAQRIGARLPGAKAGEDWWFTGWRVEGNQNIWNLVVEADNGQVTLEGEVPRLTVLRDAVDAARQVPGVRSVRSQLELQGMYGAERWRYAYRPYPYWQPYGYPYAHPYVYDRDYFVYYDRDGRDEGFQGVHTMTGKVTSLDRSRGHVTLQTAEGKLDLQFPPASLQNVRQGDRLTVRLGVKEIGNAAASPRMENTGKR